MNELSWDSTFKQEIPDPLQRGVDLARNHPILSTQELLQQSLVFNEDAMQENVPQLVVNYIALRHLHIQYCCVGSAEAVCFFKRSGFQNQMMFY